MRRSIREATVGFSLLAAIASAVGLSFWLRGISLSRQNWMVKVSFAEAAGLAERSPVTYRGVLVGSVRKVTINPEAVVAELEINHPDLKLALPAMAQIGEASLLGGEAEVALISAGKPLPPDSASPRSKNCNPSVALCNGATIEGTPGPSLTSVTTLMHKMLSAIPGITCMEPQGAFYCFPNVRGLLGKSLGGEIATDSMQLADLVLDRVKVAFVPGEAFGMPGFARFSFALGDADLKEGIERLSAFVTG